MVVRKFHNKDIRQSDSLLTLNKSLYLSVILDFWWWKFFEIAFQCVLVQVVVGGAGSPSHDTAHQSSGEFSQM